MPAHTPAIPDTHNTAAPDIARVEATGLMEHDDWKQRVVDWNIAAAVGDLRVQVGTRGILAFDSSQISIAGSSQNLEVVVPLYFVLHRQVAARTRVGELRIGVPDGAVRSRTSDVLLQQGIDDAQASLADVA